MQQDRPEAEDAPATASPDSGDATSGGPWICMDCGNRERFQVVYYDICQMVQQDGTASYSGVPAEARVDENRILQIGCGSCQSIRVGRAAPLTGEVAPGRWVQTAERSAAASGAISQDVIDEIAPSLGVPETRGSDGSLQWDLENPVAGTKVLVGYNAESRTASVYLRSGNAFIGYTALEPVTAILTDLDEGEVDFIAGRDNTTLSVTADGVFFVRPGKG